MSGVELHRIAALGLGMFVIFAAQSVVAAEWVNKKLFDFPDPTPPRMENGCAKWTSFTTFKCRGLRCSHAARNAPLSAARS
jgi:hypothetical protein